jgi:ABC-type uncharacterized transport system permease subunit
MTSGAPAAPRPSRGFARVTIEIRQKSSLWWKMFVRSAGVLVGLAISTAVLVWAGLGLGDLANEFVMSILSDSQNLANVLIQMAPLLIAGLAAAVAFRVRFWNIGIEGQMIFGSIAATLVAITDFGPESLRLGTMFIAAALGGLGWMIVPVFLKLRLGISEVISTLLLNYVALNFLLHLLYGSWQDPKSSFPHSQQYDVAERLMPLGWENVTLALPLALALALLLWWGLNISRFGFFTRFVHANPMMAKAIGVPVLGVTLAAALSSGALSGIAGFAISAGIEYRMTQSFFFGYGFSGILIGFLARNNPIAVIFVAFFVAILFVAGQSLQVFYQIPGAMVQLIQAIIVISVAAAEFFIRHRLKWTR